MSNPAKRQRVALSFSDKIKLITEHEAQPKYFNVTFAMSSELGGLQPGHIKEERILHRPVRAEFEPIRLQIPQELQVL